MVDSVSKGYQMLTLIISYLPAPITAFLFLGFGIFAIQAVLQVIKWFLGGGD